MRMRFAFFVTLSLLLTACGPSVQDRTDYDNAMRMLSGVGVPENKEEGIALLTAAAHAGVPEAELTLGYFHARGEHGLSKDANAAFDLYLRAAKHGNRDAQYNVGLAYVRSDGVKQDYEEALKWFLKAARQDDPGAQYNSGVMYLGGEGTEADPVTAYAWFALALDHGYEGAKDGMTEARAQMTEEQVRTVGEVQKKIAASVSVAPVSEAEDGAMPL